jgi:hypothetical protein
MVINAHNGLTSFVHLATEVSLIACLALGLRNQEVFNFDRSYLRNIKYGLLHRGESVARKKPLLGEVAFRRQLIPSVK